MLNLITLLKHFAHHFHNLQGRGGEQCKIWLQFPTTVAFDALSLRNEAKNLKLDVYWERRRLPCALSKISAFPPPIFDNSVFGYRPLLPNKQADKIR